MFVLGIATVYSQLEISDLDKPSESYTLYLLFILAMLERAITGNGEIEGGREGGLSLHATTVSSSEFFFFLRKLVGSRERG